MGKTATNGHTATQLRLEDSVEAKRSRKRSPQPETTAQRYMAIAARWSLIPPDDFMAFVLESTQSAVRAARSSASRDGYEFDSEPVIPPYAWNGQSWWRVTKRPDKAGDLAAELSRNLGELSMDELLAVQEAVAAARRAKRSR